MSTQLPGNSRWLGSEPGPRILQEFINIHGVEEAPGGRNNPEIMGWAEEVERACGIKLNYTADSIPWCGLGMAVVAVRAGWADQVPRNPLWARGWLLFGERAAEPMLGDVCVFSRGPAFGHVGIYVGETTASIQCLGGNQGDKVSIITMPKSRLLGARHPRWRASPPPNRRKIVVRNGAPVTTGEQ